MGESRDKDAFGAYRQSRYLLEAMRPPQWIKNLFVFAAAVFGRQLFISAKFEAALSTFGAFCLLSSAVYIFNDLIDLKEDRQHPVKRNRPLASGRLSPRLAQCAVFVLAVGSLAILYVLVSPGTFYIAVAYLVSNVVYSLYLKHMVILDVMFIAVGFVLRILAGATAVVVAPSHWLILCTLTVSLFLGFVKRRSELTVLGETAPNHRNVLKHYSRDFLDQMVSIVTAATLVCYILYTVDARTIQVFHTHLLVATVPFVMYGLFRYLYLSYHLQGGGSPTKTILLDKAFLVNGVLWAILCIVIIYDLDAIHRFLPL